MEGKNTLLFAGSARLPATLSSTPHATHLVLEMTVHATSHIVLAVSCEPFPHLGQRFICDLLLWHDLREGVDEIQATVEDRYFGPGKKAVLACLTNAYAAYLEYSRGADD